MTDETQDDVEERALEIARQAVAHATEAIEINNALLARLKVADELIAEFAEFVEPIAAAEERWEALCEASGGEEAFRALRNEARQFLAVQRRNRQLVGAINSKKAVTDEERERVLAMDAELIDEVPRVTKRHREIGLKLGLKEGRVRYIIEKSQGIR